MTPISGGLLGSGILGGGSGGAPATVTPTQDGLRLARDLLDILPETATIMRATTSPDGYGGQTKTWESIGDTPARFGPIKFTEADKVVGERFRNTQLWRVSFPVGTDVRITDRIDVGGLTLSVEGVHGPKSIQVEDIAVCTQVAA